MMFQDRREAGRLLARELIRYKGQKKVIVLAIPRGGVEVGFEIAKELKAPLDIVMSKKIPHPTDPELAIGAVSFGDSISLDESLIRQYDVPKQHIDSEIRRLKKRIDDKYEKFKGNKKFPSLKNKIVILTDDGIAMGHTMFAAIKFIRKMNPSEIIVAVPVAPEEVTVPIESEADKYIALSIEKYFIAVGGFYKYFPQVEDDEVKKLLEEAKKWAK